MMSWIEYVCFALLVLVALTTGIAALYLWISQILAGSLFAIAGLILFISGFVTGTIMWFLDYRKYRK